MEFPRHHRTASKNLQTFRFICTYEPTDLTISKPTGFLLFRVGELWNEFKTLPNITSTTSFSICYIFEELLDVKLEIRDDEKVIDENIFNLVTLISKTSHSFVMNNGKLTVCVEEVKDNNSALALKITGNIKGGFIFWRPSYYINISRRLDSGEYLQVYRTETVPGRKCLWKKFVLPFNVLGGSPVKFEIFNDTNEKIGDIEMTINELLTPGKRFDLIYQNKNKGTIKIAWSELELKQNFIDYLRSGLNIKVIVAVDYTSSNLPYNLILSNHYICEGKQNPYEESIKRVVEVLDVYNKDRTIHLFGFGGIPERSSTTSHCFPLGQAQNSASLLKLYRDSLPSIAMSKPTIMNEIVTKAQKICQEDKDPNSYYVVLILTDGDIHDYPQTSTNIVYSCKFPLSFIIVGIGNADFASMERLDSDGVPLKDREGRIAERDIVQFVPYNLYKHHPGLLAAKVLEELPEQICGYMDQRPGKQYT